MIVVQLKGGLGNQMFQYAFGRQLAHQHRTELRLDTRWFDDHSSRRYQLEAFRIAARVATPRDIDTVTRRGKRGVALRMMQSMRTLRPCCRPAIVEEKNLDFDPGAILASQRCSYCMGYWQSERYFKPVATMLRNEFRLGVANTDTYMHWARQISGQMSVSVHIRRGDYIQDGAVNLRHGVCTAEYFETAISRLRSFEPSACVYVFSDDHAWAHDFVSRNDNSYLVALTGDHRDQEELLLMSLCRHHIISNSTYGWWGAWLGSAQDNVVIAPRTWYAHASLRNEDIVPDSWIRI